MILKVDTKVIEAFNEVASDKYGYISICCFKGVIIFYADVKEVVKMALSEIEADSEFSFRAPLEVLSNLIKLGEVTITKQIVNENKTNLIMEHISQTGRVEITYTIPYEPCIAQDTIVEISNAMHSDTGKIITDLSSFKKMINMCRPASKDIVISGAQIRDNKITVISNGYYAEAKDTTGLQTVIPISTLKAINSFLSGFSRAKYISLNGYNYLICNNSVIGWRRVRTEKLDYTIQVQPFLKFDVGYLREVVNSIVSPVKYVTLSVSRKILAIETSVASTIIPLNINSEDEQIPDFEINSKLFFNLVKGFKGIISLGFFNKSLTIENDDVLYIIGRTI